MGATHYHPCVMKRLVMLGRPRTLDPNVTDGRVPTNSGPSSFPFPVAAFARMRGVATLWLYPRSGERGYAFIVCHEPADAKNHHLKNLYYIDRDNT